jgi:hypothetical protein
LGCPRTLAIYTSALTLVLLGCDGGTEITERCLVDLAPISARTAMVSVGDTATFNASLGPAECLPSDIVTEEWRWSSTDTLIARIDSLTGVAEGVSPGDVVIQVQHALDPRVASPQDCKWWGISV